MRSGPFCDNLPLEMSALTTNKIGEAVGVAFTLSNWRTEPENKEIQDFSLFEPEINNINNSSSTKDNKYSVNKPGNCVDIPSVNTTPNGNAKEFSLVSVQIPKLLLGGEVSSQKGQISLMEKKRPGLFRRRSSSFDSGAGGTAERAKMAGLLPPTVNDNNPVRRYSYGGRSSREDWTTEVVDGVLETNLCSTEL